MSSVAFLAWFLTFCLEARGSFRGFRYRAELKTLFGFLLFSSVADAFKFAVYLVDRTSYAWAWWASWAVTCVILCFLGCQVCGRLLAEKNERAVTFYAAILAISAGLLSGIVFSQGETLKNRLLDGSLAADAMILGLIVIAYCSQKRGLDRHWQAIGLGIVVHVAWELLVTLAWLRWDAAKHFFPIGELTALILWNYAVRSETVVRQSLGVVCEPTEIIKARIV